MMQVTWNWPSLPAWLCWRVVSVSDHGVQSATHVELFTRLSVSQSVNIQMCLPDVRSSCSHWRQQNLHPLVSSLHFSLFI